MELQYFCPPEESAAHFGAWVARCEGWLTGVVGLSKASVRRREYGPGVRDRRGSEMIGGLRNPRPRIPSRQELAHYALATTDLEFEFPFGWDELWGIANRGDFDLRAHSRASGLELVYRDPVSNKVCWPLYY